MGPLTWAIWWKRCHGFDLFDASNDVGSTSTADMAERLLDLGPEQT
jgi:hypothetical protein